MQVLQEQKPVKGVIQEKAIMACRDGSVTFRYQDSKTKQMRTRTLPGPQFLWLILLHVLPKGFRRTRNFGFLHANSKRVLELLQRLLKLNPVKTLVGMAKRPRSTVLAAAAPCGLCKRAFLPRWHSGGSRHPANGVEA